MSLVDDLKKAIKDEIKRRPYKAKDKLPGIRELAKIYGVSYVTMSNVLGQLTQEGLIERFPGKGTFFTEMVSKNSFALMIPDFLIGMNTIDPRSYSSCVFGLVDIYAGLMAQAQEEGFYLHVIPVTVDDRNDMDYLEQLVTKLGVAGIFFLALPSNRLINHFDSKGFLCCQLYTPGDSNHYCIATDFEVGAYKIVKHLTELGHKRIGLIAACDADNPWFIGRHRGYERALTESGIKIDKNLKRIILENKAIDDSLEQAVDSFLALKDKLSAFFVTSDLWALKIIKILQSKNISVPEDISVVGFDDYVESKVFVPPLTTVAQPFFEIGKKAIFSMKKLLLDPSEKGTLLIEPNLIIRSSTAPVKN
jgi:DNA-binding LacI/PurR family transcriptional regulator